jgi:DNA-directed RNA polymerase III subunit RPC1
MGLFYTLNRDNSSELSAEVMLRATKLSSRWITNFGMTIGIGDVTPT